MTLRWVALAALFAVIPASAEARGHAHKHHPHHARHAQVADRGMHPIDPAHAGRVPPPWLASGVHAAPVQTRVPLRAPVASPLQRVASIRDQFVEWR